MKITDNYRLLSVKDYGYNDALVYERVWKEASALRNNGTLKSILPSLFCEIIIIHGKQDPHPLTGITEPMNELGLKFKLYMLDRCGHSPFIEAGPAPEFYSLIDRILNENAYNV